MEEHRLRVFENGVLKNMIGPKMEEVIRVLIKLRGELSYLAPLGSEKISAPYFKQCFFRGGGITH